MRKKFPGSVCNTTYGGLLCWIAGSEPAFQMGHESSISAPVRDMRLSIWRKSWDGAARLPALLADNDFVIRSARPHVFCLRPDDYMWQWPATFIEIYLPRLVGMGRIDQEFADKLHTDLRSAERNPNTLMITPLVLEIVAEKTTQPT